ncbi:MAG: biotin/lipoyl-binding protein, partial [Planctomycetota bacterium]
FHEFGHGLSCKRLGGECHEIGFMLLVLTPCLYCNVSDSWRLSNKWHRAAIGAAGMYVEIILASLATFCWWYAEPGWIQDLCLQVMLVSSVSTILFNGNPLLRFDGYYILSDLLEIPNLYQKSTKALTTMLGRHWLGLEIPDDQLMPSNRPWAFALFTIAAFCYRWVILVSIIIFLTRWLEPYGLDSVGRGIAIFAGAGMIFWPSYKLFRYMSVPGRMHQIEKPRFAIITAIALVVIGAVLFIPFPHYLRCSLIMMPQSMETIYVHEPGLVNELNVANGDVIDAGTVIAKLDNVDLELALQQGRGQLTSKEAEKEALVAGGSSTVTPQLINQLAVVDAQILQLRRFVSDVETRKANLEIKSHISGTVLETPFRQVSATSEEIPLLDPQSFLSRRNKNLAAQRGQRFCEIADLSRWYAVVIMNEDQVNLARQGQEVQFKLYSNPSEVVYSEVESLGVADQSIRRETKNNASLMTNSAPGQKSDALPDLITEMVEANFQSELQYFARVPYDPGDKNLKIGLGGQARIYTGNRSLGNRIWRWFNQNFRS